MTRIKIHTVGKYKTILKPKIEKHKGYSMQWWRDYSLKKRQLNPVCVHCNRLMDASKLVTDHIIPVNYNGSFEDVRNHQTICISCHSKKTVKEKKVPLYLYISNESGKLIPQLDKQGNLIAR
jgi:5-methylcytosine-specific restriction endonuclease McrA